MIRRLLCGILIVASAAQQAQAAPRLLVASTSLGDVYEVLTYATTPTCSVLVDFGVQNFEDIAAGTANDPIFGIENGSGDHHLYSINLVAGNHAPIGQPTSPADLHGLDYGCNGTLYASGLDAKIYEVDRLSGSATELLSAAGWGGIADIAYASVSPVSGASGFLYAAAEGSASGGDQLLRIDLATMQVVALGMNTLPEGTRGMDCNADLELWGVTGNAGLFRIDPVTGVSTSPVTISGVGPVRGANGLAFIDVCKVVGVQPAHWGAVKALFR